MQSLSVITVNKNNATGLFLTLKSIASQSYRNFELIVVDGGSDDESLNIIQQFKTIISKWISEPDGGIFHAQNKGIQMATGDYCLFLNSGDYLAKEDVLQKIVSANSSADILYGDMLLINDGDKPVLKKSPEHIGAMRMIKDTLWHPVSFIRRSLFTEFGNYDERYRIVADYEFFVRTIIKHKVKTRHIEVTVSAFDQSGISSNPLYRNQLVKERMAVQNIYFNPILLFIFRLYSKLRN